MDFFDLCRLCEGMKDSFSHCSHVYNVYIITPSKRLKTSEIQLLSVCLHLPKHDQTQHFDLGI